MTGRLDIQAPQSLARLLDVEELERGKWNEAELEQILKHQLETPLLYDLASIGESDQNVTIPYEIGSEPCSFGELFRHPQPPTALLLLVKEFAKISDRRTDNPLPPEISTVLYYAAILAAKLRLNLSISSLSAKSLREGIRWALAKKWIAPIRELFSDGLSALQDEGTSVRNRV